MDDFINLLLEAVRFLNDWLFYKWDGLLTGAAITAVFAVGPVFAYRRKKREKATTYTLSSGSILSEHEERMADKYSISELEDLDLPPDTEIQRKMDHQLTGIELVVDPDDSHHAPVGADEPPTPEQKGEELFVKVHYATDRKPTGSKEVGEYFGSERGELRYGYCLVSIPPAPHHKMGILERPSWMKLQWDEDARKHVVLRSLNDMEKNQFFEDLRADVSKVDSKSVFVFIHGFNVTFEEAAHRAAQLAYDLFIIGSENEKAELSVAPILYSWPSNGAVQNYLHDINNADATVGKLKAFIKDVAVRTGAKSIVLVAHSMGNRALAYALNEIGLEMREGDGPLVKEIILAAPDIDQDVFMRLSEAIERTGERVTLYASSKDWALKASKKIHGFRRLGDSSGGVSIFGKADSIDASVLGDDILAHSYVGQVSIINDLYYLIKHGFGPDERSGLLGQGTSPKRYWKFRPKAGT